MPKKCESCKHYFNYGGDLKNIEFCQNREVVPSDHPWAKQGLWLLEKDDLMKKYELQSARDICDREGDGIFVHFEPKDPETGSTFAAAECTSPRVSKGDTRNSGPPQLAMRAAA